ncbi:hypothetical protein [Cellvibrio sp. NN19]|uniref:hypothetical protein n=1 Tax=Cellvibrio chitinivorans TaxID=3102792 RepID=UPI002B412866|nr:hypothetical protein [Cellvibrio sp. NN19]
MSGNFNAFDFETCREYGEWLVRENQIFLEHSRLSYEARECVMDNIERGREYLAQGNRSLYEYDCERNIRLKEQYEKKLIATAARRHKERQVREQKDIVRNARRTITIARTRAQRGDGDDYFEYHKTIPLIARLDYPPSYFFPF